MSQAKNPKSIDKKRKRNQLDLHQEDEATKKKQRRWTEGDISEVFAYLKETIDLGLVIEKPNAVVYYARLIEKKKLVDCTPSIVRDKVRHLQTKYKEALKWRDETGQGIRDTDGEQTFLSTTLRRYPHFEMAHEIWGSKASIHVPYQMTSLQIGPFADDFSLVLAGTVTSTPTPSTSSRNDVGVGDVTIEEIEGSQGIDEEPYPTTSTSEDNLLPRISPSAQRFLSRTNSRLGNGTTVPKNSREAYTEVSKMRCDLEKDKLNFQKEQMTIQKQREDADFELRREQFEFDKSLKETELELRRQEIQNHTEIRLAEVKSQERIRMKELEIDKLRVEAQNKP